MPYDQAVTTLQDDGFELGDTLDGFSNNATAGLVARQSPVAGSSLKRNGSVTLTVVRPLASLITPDLVGQTQTQAESALATLSLKPAVAQDYSTAVAAGVVIVQAPPAGAPINPGDTVDLVISKGPAPAQAKVPAINGKKQADAEAALKSAGLVPAPYQSYSDTVAKGIVTGQNPVAGATMAPGSKVTFVVSLGQGAQSVSVPNVVGKSQADAEAALRSAGLVPSAVLNVSPSVPKGIVAGQSPTAGSKTGARRSRRHPGLARPRHLGDRSQCRRQDVGGGGCGDQGRRPHPAGGSAAGRRSACGYRDQSGTGGRRQGRSRIDGALHRLERCAQGVQVAKFAVGSW